jgi:O-antigen/teichoic acid export membrane protein
VEKDKTKKDSLTDQSIFLLIGNFLRQGTTIFQAMILARLLTLVEFGSFRQITMLTYLVYVFSYLCLSESGSYFLATLNKDDKKKFVFQTLIMFFILGTLAMVIMVLFRDRIAGSFNNPDLANLILIGSIMPMTQMMNIFSSVCLITIGRAKLNSVISFIMALIVILSISLPVMFGVSFNNAFRWYIFFQVLTAIFSCINIIHFIGFKPAFDKKLLAEQFKFSIPYWISYSTLMLYTQIHKVIVSAFFTPEDFAQFSVASQEIPILNRLSSQVALVLIPVCVEFRLQGKNDRIIALWQKLSVKIAMVSLPVFMLFMLSPRQILTVLWGETYNTAWLIFMVISLMIPLRICDVQSLFKITGRTQHVIYSSLAALFVGVFAGWGLIYPLGMLGPAIGMVLGRLVQIYVSMLFIRKDLPITYSQAFGLKYVWKISLAALAAFLFAKGIAFFIHPPFINLALNGIIGGIVFLLLLLKFNLILDEDKVLIKRWLTLRPMWEK